MEKLIVDVPSMYADHHVLTVRDLLTSMKGVGDVYASSAFKQVMVQYDPAVVTAEAITSALADAGYTGEMEMPIQGKLPEDAWRQGSFRMTRTFQADLEMSGEFRKY
jgi:copper chaperone CopZ